MKSIDRRKFIKSSALATGGVIILPTIISSCKGKPAPSDKINVAFIGAGGKGIHAINVLKENPLMNIVAFADVDFRKAAQAFEQFPDVNRYYDFRKMLRKMGKEIDAVIISTPDHTHHYIAKYCMLKGKHVYLEKPLAHNIHEVRDLMALEKETGLVCQMGNQGHSSIGFKKLDEWINKGFLGDVNEVYAWTKADWNDAGAQRPEKQPIPKGVDWDLWLGPAAEVDYNKAYMPGRWRGWNEFGSGALGDFACHNMDAPYSALGLQCPDKVEVESTGPSLLSFPKSAKLTFHFPESKFGNKVKFSWYQGPTFLPPKPVGFEPGTPFGNNMGGTVIIGSEATVISHSHSTNPSFIPNSKHEELKSQFDTYENPGVWNDHYDNWLLAIKGEAKISSSFFDGGRLTETMLWGNIALKTNTDLNINPNTKEIINNAEATELMGYPKPRKGWEI
ncbi:Gfo/Idh/MocA family oxidoreductase [uncultured Draconibacterium sp.]|uniref:Gfo/Idh/MocA family protein n=1 Tax=uncultured Draconibacterium sp. TaxID=1573823 RepID=UPI00326042F2